MVQLPQVSVVDSLRQPEYTGENRCMPCTVTNLLIAVVLSALVSYGGLVAVGAGAGVGAGTAVLLFSLGAIYLRGYLVPGTPTLTKRYFPEWLLDLFGKAEVDQQPETIDADIDVESVLLEADAIEPTPDGDLALTAEFRTALFDQIETEQREDTSREALADIVGIDADGLEFESFGDGAFMAFVGRDRVGSWESRAAFLADAAAGRLLPDRYDDWDRTGPAGRGAILGGLRLFLDRCPGCDGSVRFGQEVVESCCRSRDVVAVTCEDCDARLFEVEVTEEMLAGEPGAEAGAA